MLIFVQIAAYRDSLLGSTLRDLLEKAGNPENLRVTICHQYHPDDAFNAELDVYRDDDRFNIIDMLYHESRGLCWARNLIQQHYKGEAYTLQVDSHMRFIQNWDTVLINMLVSLQERGYPKPVLTTYPPHFEPTAFEYREVPPNQIVLREFDKHGVYPIGWPAEIPGWEALTAPVPARFLAGGFAFSIGAFCQDVQDDPHLYFMGEEINIALRAYTHGYDLFHPHINITWHYYSRRESPKHWEDHAAIEAVELLAMDRLRRFFESGEKTSGYDWGIYGLGKERTLRDYEEFAGILLCQKKAQPYTLKHLPPPNPRIYPTEQEWLDSFCCCVNNVLHIPHSVFVKDDYDQAVIAFAADKRIVHELELDAAGVAAMIQRQFDSYTLEVGFSCSHLPDSWILSLHSASSGWEKKIRGRMPYFVAGLGNFSIKKCQVL
ncbi:hypothetical protein HHL17_22550 [Chitinophaga sp. G-6-1-13]|uniref:Glycosyltransferase (GlcNAc) n=1 Tax=Chitinophaga fulva TaxID=2728842 RepID=A0A848GRL0_9BACT|nr:GlcNAc-transferase family protein [Chitinophaga fulva]NML39999.1 hypothetical protein [Chitinophaga fulva]